MGGALRWGGTARCPRGSPNGCGAADGREPGGRGEHVRGEGGRHGGSWVWGTAHGDIADVGTAHVGTSRRWGPPAHSGAPPAPRPPRPPAAPRGHRASPAQREGPPPRRTDGAGPGPPVGVPVRGAHPNAARGRRAPFCRCRPRSPRREQTALCASQRGFEGAAPLNIPRTSGPERVSKGTGRGAAGGAVPEAPRRGGSAAHRLRVRPIPQLRAYRTPRRPRGAMAAGTARRTAAECGHTAHRGAGGVTERLPLEAAL